MEGKVFLSAGYNSAQHFCNCNTFCTPTSSTTCTWESQAPTGSWRPRYLPFMVDLLRLFGCSNLAISSDEGRLVDKVQHHSQFRSASPRTDHDSPRCRRKIPALDRLRRREIRAGPRAPTQRDYPWMLITTVMSSLPSHYTNTPCIKPQHCPVSSVLNAVCTWVFGSGIIRLHTSGRYREIFASR